MVFLLQLKVCWVEDIDHVENFNLERVVVGEVLESGVRPAAVFVVVGQCVL